MDFNIQDHDSIVIVEPLTSEAKEWVEESVSDDGFQPNYPNQIYCERRFVMDLLFDAQEAGLTMAIEGREFTLQPV